MFSLEKNMMKKLDIPEIEVILGVSYSPVVDGGTGCGDRSSAETEHSGSFP